MGGAQKQCFLHNCPLKIEEVPVVYGLVSVPKAYRNAQITLFPLANSYHDGGCVVSNQSPDTRKTEFCEECRDAEKKWKDEHPLGQLRGLPI